MKPLSGLDGTFLHLETPETPMHVGSLHLFDLPEGYGGDFHADIKRLMRRRLHLAPIFQRKLAPMPLQFANPVWIEDDNLDLDYHVRRVALPGPGTLRQLLDLAEVMLQSPLDVSDAMRTRVLPQGAGSAANKSWVFTSATLGHDAELSWMVQSCGLAGARILKVPSPFDYAQQAALYVPKDFPKPAEAGHSHAVARLALQGAQVLGGRTLVLTTTLRAMRSIGDTLALALQGHDDMQVLVQGAMPKRELLARFLQAGAGGLGGIAGPGGAAQQAGAILVASATFWEGIDMPGEALQLLVIDKLPFTPPDDPVLQARSKALEAQGKSPFKHLHLPQAAVALRQGAGRLIRRESDQGVLVVCDVRLNQMGYGRQLVAALPAMRRLGSAGEFAEALAALTRPSTTDHPSSSSLPW